MLQCGKRWCMRGPGKDLQQKFGLHQAPHSYQVHHRTMLWGSRGPHRKILENGAFWYVFGHIFLNNGLILKIQKTHWKLRIFSIHFLFWLALHYSVVCLYAVGVLEYCYWQLLFNTGRIIQGTNWRFHSFVNCTRLCASILKTWFHLRHILVCQ